MIKNINKILDIAIEKKASDIHFQSGKTPAIRVNSKLFAVDDADLFSMEESI